MQRAKFHRSTPKKARSSRERGQAAVFLVLALGLFLIGGIGFVVDGANLWFHRQTAQTAADAACTAGAMDMLSVAAGADIPSTPWASSAGTYAGFNGYQSGALSVSFPTSFAGIPSSSTCLTPAAVCAADQVVTATPLYMQVTVNDTVPTTFMRFVGAGSNVNVPARSTCGLSNVLSPVPVLVLNPNLADTMTGSGFTLAVSYASAPQNPSKVLQVNSSNADAVTGLTGTVNLSNPDATKGNFGIGGQSTPGSDGSYTTVNVAGVVSDPFAAIVPPERPSQNGSFTQRVTNSDCPSGNTCDIYTPGYWPGLTVHQHPPGQGGGGPTGLAVFEPGIYYLDGNFVADSNTCLRPSASTGSSGVVFYFHNGSLQISSQSGQLVRASGFNCQTNTVAVSMLGCPSASTANLPAGGISGNVLLAPCEGTYTDINGNQQLVGDPLGTNDPIGEQRGMLFFQDRDSAASPSWSSANSFGLIGNIYFHHCGSGSGSGASCSSSAFDDTLTLGSGGNGYIVGDIVVDQLAISSGANINVSLNPNPQYYVLKASLLQ